MVDQSVLTLLSSFGLNMLVFSITWVVWIIIKNHRSKDLDEELFENTQLPMIEEQKLNAWQIWKEVYKVSDNEIIAARTPEALIYLKLHKRLATAFAILAVLGCSILIPLYAQGDDFDDELIKTATIANILDETEYIIGMVLCLFIFTIIIYFILIKSYAESMKYKKLNRCRLEERSIEITNFDGEISVEEATKLISDKCNEIIPGSVDTVKVAPVCKQLYALLLKMKDVRENLEYYKEVNGQNEKRAKMFSITKRGFVDAEEHLTESETQLKTEIDAVELPENQNSTFAIVTCTDDDTASQLKKAFWKRSKWWRIIFRSNEDPSLSWQVKKAANAKDILWDNIGMNRTALNAANCCSNTLIILLLLFLFTPTALISILADTLSGLGMGFEIVIVNLPALIVLLYMEVIIPLCVDGMVKKEFHYRRSDATASDVNKYLSIMIFMVFGAGIVGLQIIGIMLEWKWEEWVPTFGEQIILTGDYYTILIMQMAFIKMGFALLALGKWIKGVARAKVATTALETKRAWQLEPWELGRQYAQSCTVFIVCLCYSLIVPYMVIIAFFYFLNKYWYNKNLLMTCYYIEYDSRGLVAQVVLRCLLICVSVFWFISGAMLLLTGEKDFMMLGSIVAFTAITSIILIQCFDKYIWKLGREAEGDLEIGKGILEDENDYTHPCLLLTEEDPYNLR